MGEQQPAGHMRAVAQNASMADDRWTLDYDVLADIAPIAYHYRRLDAGRARHVHLAIDPHAWPYLYAGQFDFHFAGQCVHVAPDVFAQIAYVTPVPSHCMDMKGDATPQKVREQPAPEVIELTVGDVAQDLRLKDVYSTVAEARTGLLAGGFLLKTHDAVVVVGDYHPRRGWGRPPPSPPAWRWSLYDDVPTPSR